MNQQEDETVERLSNEENDGQDFFEFADLNLPDTQLAEIKGGPSAGSHNSNQGWGKWEFNHNHNETVAVEDEEEAEAIAPLADLSVGTEQEERVKGGGRTEQTRQVTVIQDL